MYNYKKLQQTWRCFKKIGSKATKSQIAKLNLPFLLIIIYGGNIVVFLIQVLKKSAPKGDKKKKKEVNDAIARLENDLEQKHKGELENFERINKVDQVER